jgi:RNase P/RNase MRP subunit p29
MSSVKTSHPSASRKLQSGTAIYGANGLPIDSIAELSGSFELLRDMTGVLQYNNGTVTVPNGTDLNKAKFHKSIYTGRLVLIDADDNYYFISRPSINQATLTFNIYDSQEELTSPLAINLGAGWVIAEAQLVNRLAVTAAAKIDQVSFRDFQVQFRLEGDPVRIVDKDGNGLVINPEGDINVRGVVQPQMMNVQLLLASNEYEIILPKETKRFSFKIRNATSAVKFGYASVSTNPYTVVERGLIYTEDKITRTEDLSIFIQANKDNQLLELIYWT